jgi:hypothetical protein
MNCARGVNQNKQKRTKTNKNEQKRHNPAIQDFRYGNGAVRLFPLDKTVAL